MSGLTDSKNVPRFGTIRGVFRPTVLTILGAMLYLREGWLVGNCGLLGAIGVILAAYAVTGTTALSLSSLATNTRLRPGGAFAIISQALGLEAGGAIGIPLYIAQAASAAMYLYAFSEGFVYLFPEADPQMVVAVAFLVVAAMASRSAQLAFKAQALMQFVVVLALVSAFGGVFDTGTRGLHRPEVWGALPEATLLGAFAIFFPAATGIMVGVGMSGSLEDPRRAIPRGTLAAWGVSLGIYLLGAFWYAAVAAPEDLLRDKTLMVDRALYGPIVLFGLLSSTLTAALSSMVAAPRLLQAMADHQVVPMAAALQCGSDGEPRRAAAVTFAIVGLSLLTGSLDAIAPIITSFFIVTYLAVNLVVFLEQRLQMISFRPTFSVPGFVPLAGVVICLLCLVSTSQGFGVLELALVAGIYVWLAGRRLHTPWDTVRSAIPDNIAAWAARRSHGGGRSHRAWRPDLLVPVDDPIRARAQLPLLVDLTRRSGSVKLVALGTAPALREAVASLERELRTREVVVARTALEETDFARGTRAALDALGAAFFPPNLLVVDGRDRGEAELQALLDRCRERRVGLLLHFPPPPTRLDTPDTAAVWLSERSPDWALKLRLANLDLPVLLAWLLSRRRGGRMRLHCAITDPAHAQPAQGFLAELIGSARLPKDTGAQVHLAPFFDALAEAPPARFHIFGLPATVNAEHLARVREHSRGACLFVLDSGQESALA